MIHQVVQKLSGPLGGFFTVFFAVSITAWATDDLDLSKLKAMSLDEVLKVDIPTVYGASKHDQKTTEAPSEVTVITREEIQKYGHRTLADILNSVRDFYVSYDRNYGYIGVRGFNRPGDFGGRVLLLVDGHRMNDLLYDTAANKSDFLIDVDLIERVEVIRGPGSSLYGNNAFFAVVNVITRTGGDVNGIEASGEAGSQDSYKSRLTYGKKFDNGLEVLLSGSLFHSDGNEQLFYKEFDQPENNHGIADHLDGDQFYSGFGTVSYQDFTLQLAYVSRRKDVPTGAYGAVFDYPDDFTVDSRGYADLRYAHTFTNDINVQGRVFYDYYDYFGNYPNSGVDPNDPEKVIINRDAGRVESAGVEVQASKKLFDTHRFTLGADFRDGFLIEQKNFDLQPRTTYLGIRQSEENYSVFLQDEWSIAKSLVLNGGVRYDHYSTVGSTVDPRAALIWNPTNETTLKLIYGQAFRAPNAYELYYFSTTQKANPNLDPEHIRSYELAWEQSLNKNLRFSASGFYNSISDLVSETTDPTDGLTYYKNLDRAVTKGVSAELDGKFAHGVEGRLSYTYQRTENSLTGQELSNSPTQLAKLNFIVPLYRDKIFSGLELQYGGSVKTLEDTKAKGFLIANWTLFSKELVKGVEISASVYNLFDTRYGFPGGEEHIQDVIEQDGRTFRIKLEGRF